MIKFLHAADLHLDSPFHGLAPAEAAKRRQEQRQMLTEIAELANSQLCDLVLLAGDLFDSDNAYPDTVQALCRALGSINGRVFIAPGNHDCLYAGSPYFSGNFPENVHIFKSESMESVSIPALGCTVYGAGFQSPVAPGLLEGFQVSDPGTRNLMVLHGDAETPQSSYNPIAKTQIETSGLDYLALGHIHLRTEPKKIGKTTYCWPGCPMGRGFDELGEKGVYVGQLSETECNLTFHPLNTRRYEILEVAAGDDPLSAIEAALPTDTQEHIYRIRLTGESDPIDLRTLHAALESRFSTLHLRNETTSRVDIWQEAGEDTLRGQFLALLQAKRQYASEEVMAIIDMAAKLGLDAMEGREEGLSL